MNALPPLGPDPAPPLGDGPDSASPGSERSAPDDNVHGVGTSILSPLTALLGKTKGLLERGWKGIKQPFSSDAPKHEITASRTASVAGRTESVKPAFQDDLIDEFREEPDPAPVRVDVRREGPEPIRNEDIARAVSNVQNDFTNAINTNRSTQILLADAWDKLARIDDCDRNTLSIKSKLENTDGTYALETFTTTNPPITCYKIKVTYTLQVQDRNGYPYEISFDRNIFTNAPVDSRPDKALLAASAYKNTVMQIVRNAKRGVDENALQGYPKEEEQQNALMGQRQFNFTFEHSSKGGAQRVNGIMPVIEDDVSPLKGLQLKPSFSKKTYTQDVKGNTFKSDKGEEGVIKPDQLNVEKDEILRNAPYTVKDDRLLENLEATGRTDEHIETLRKTIKEKTKEIEEEKKSFITTKRFGFSQSETETLKNAAAFFSYLHSSESEGPKLDSDESNSNPYITDLKKKEQELLDLSEAVTELRNQQGELQNFDPDSEIIPEDLITSLKTEAESKNLVQGDKTDVEFCLAYLEQEIKEKIQAGKELMTEKNALRKEMEETVTGFKKQLILFKQLNQELEQLAGQLETIGNTASAKLKALPVTPEEKKRLSSISRKIGTREIERTKKIVEANKEFIAGIIDKVMTPNISSESIPEDVLEPDDGQREFLVSDSPP